MINEMVHLLHDEDVEDEHKKEFCSNETEKLNSMKTEKQDSGDPKGRVGDMQCSAWRGWLGSIQGGFGFDSEQLTTEGHFTVFDLWRLDSNLSLEDIEVAL